MMISGVHASTTVVALQSLRSLSYDDEGVAIEAAMGPLFDAIEQCEMGVHEAAFSGTSS